MSALEDWRRHNVHLYKLNPEAQVPLWTDGLNRRGSRWRHNNGGIKTEGGRRKKIITLIDALAVKPKWNIELAL